MAEVVKKSIGIWMVIVIAAIINGATREKLIEPLIGSGLSLPLSGITLSVLILMITYFTIPFIGEVKTEVYFIIGLLWVVLTLAFEYLFGHYVADKPWHEINQVFNILKGDLFIFVLIVSAASPYVAAKIKGLT